MAESTPRGNEFNTPQYAMAANTIIYAGDVVSIERAANANKGYALPASTGATTQKVKGVATKTVDNRTTNTVGNSGLVGGAMIPVEITYSDKGLRAYKMLNDTGTPVVQADVGGLCYVKDSKTITGSPTTAPTAGEVFRIDPTDGMPWVIFNQ